MLKLHEERSDEERSPCSRVLLVIDGRSLCRGAAALCTALVSAPRLALGSLVGIGPVLGDPRLAVTGIFLSLSRIVPDRYPLERDVHDYIAEENAFGQMLDYGIIQPRLQRLYEWSAEELGEPRVLHLVRDGSPGYAWPFEHRDVWEPARPMRAARELRRILPVR